MAARSELALVQGLGVPALNEILEPECRLPFTSPAQVAACDAVIARKLEAKRLEDAGSFTKNVLQPLVVGLGSFLIPGSGLVGGVATRFASEPPPTGPTQLQLRLNALKGGGMSFADGDSSGFSLPSFGDIGQILQGGLGQQLLTIGGNLAQTALQGSFGQPQVYQTSMAAVPAIARAGAMVGRSFFNKFPNLATAIQGFLNRGIPATRSKLYGLLKRFGPDFLVTGGILTAAAVSELTIAGPGRRRMNPGNIKALRKAHRRMKAFHHVCQTNDALLTHRRKAPRSFGGARTQITQVK